MKTKKILAILIMAIMLIGVLPISVFAESTLPTYSGGVGTEQSPYLISTPDDLISLQEFINSGGADSLDAADNCGLGAYHGYHFKLTNDLDMTGYEWTPMNFCGVFDGNGYTISNMQMNPNFFESADPDNPENPTYASSEYQACFFGQLVHATVKNLYLRECTATVSNDLDPSSTRDIYAGILAGTAIASSIENCAIANCTIVQNGKEENFGYSAGLIGYADICHIENCSVEGGSITIGGDAGDSQYAGGIVGGIGDMYNEYLQDYNMVVGAGKDFGVFNCYSTASITTEKGIAVGGIVGMTVCDFLDLKIENCYVGGNIDVSCNAGGIVGDGWTNDMISNCVILAESITSDKNAYAISKYSNADNTTNCKISTSTTLIGTVSTDFNGLTPVEMTDADLPTESIKSNLYGKLADGRADVTVTLSKNGETVYTTKTESDGGYSFGKKIVPGEYELEISEDNVAEAYAETVVVGFTENLEMDIKRELKPVGIKKVEKISSDGNIDTYTIYYTDDTTYTFTVTNGEDGANGADGNNGADGKDGVNGADGNNGADGKDGANGADGKDGSDAQASNGLVIVSLIIAIVALIGNAVVIVLYVMKNKKTVE